MSTQRLHCNVCDKSCSKVGNYAELMAPGNVDLGSDEDEGSTLPGKP